MLTVTCMLLNDTCTSHTWNSHVAVNIHGGCMVHACQLFKNFTYFVFHGIPASSIHCLIWTLLDLIKNYPIFSRSVVLLLLGLN